MNKAIILGRLGRDPELKYIPSGQAVCNFSVATSEKYKDKQGNQQEKTEWHKVVVWGKSAEHCNTYLRQGSQALIEGKITTRKWENKDGATQYTTEISASNVQFIGARNENNQGHSAPSENQGEQPSINEMFTSDDIPF